MAEAVRWALAHTVSATAADTTVAKLTDTSRAHIKTEDAEARISQRITCLRE
jgi:hypothetical protein